MNKKCVSRWILLGIVLLIVAFIWENSLQPVRVSAGRSGRIMELISPILAFFVGKEGVTDHLVRKLAHFTEFSALGFFLYAFRHLTVKKRSSAVLFSLCTGLSVAAVDETLQIFSHRGPAVKDVALDFSGVLFGTALLFFALLLFDRISGRRREKTDHSLS